MLMLIRWASLKFLAEECTGIKDPEVVLERSLVAPSGSFDCSIGRSEDFARLG
jgi:hypothetical protein